MRGFKTGRQDPEPVTLCDFLSTDQMIYGMKRNVLGSQLVICVLLFHLVLGITAVPSTGLPAERSDSLSTQDTVARSLFQVPQRLVSIHCTSNGHRHAAELDALIPCRPGSPCWMGYLPVDLRTASYY